MTDRELLEAAAKAAGMNVSWNDHPEHEAKYEGMFLNGFRSPSNSKYWNPLTDDGDALRLAVKLRLEIDIHHTGVAVRTPQGQKVLVDADEQKDPYAASRSAIVRAAAEVVAARPGGRG